MKGLLVVDSSGAVEVLITGLAPQFRHNLRGQEEIILGLVGVADVPGGEEVYHHKAEKHIAVHI